MMTAKDRILKLLRGDALGFDALTIATYLDIPEASVRRNISELRARGRDIRLRDGYYVLHGA